MATATLELTDPKIGDFYAEDGASNGPCREDSDDAIEAFVAQEGHSPERVVQVTTIRIDGVDVDIIWEADGESVWPDDEEDEIRTLDELHSDEL
jgi:hypothetical protein